MTTFEAILQLLTALLPTLSVLMFLLLHRRQSIQADLETVRLRHDERTQLSAARSNAMQALSAALVDVAHRAFPRQSVATDLSDEALIHELDRRASEDDWKHGNPFTSLDSVLHQTWAARGDDNDDDDDIPHRHTEPS